MERIKLGSDKATILNFLTNEKIKRLRRYPLSGHWIYNRDRLCQNTFNNLKMIKLKMTKLIILLCFSFGRVAGQTTTQARSDTIPVIMLVGDTSDSNPIRTTHALLYRKDSTERIVDYIWQIRGYEVRENNPTFDQTYHGTLAIAVMSWVDHFTHVAYLDEKKKPLRLYVWQSVKP
jgi:hypothetical protein